MWVDHAEVTRRLRQPWATAHWRVHTRGGKCQACQLGHSLVLTVQTSLSKVKLTIWTSRFCFGVLDTRRNFPSWLWLAGQLLSLQPGASRPSVPTLRKTPGSAGVSDGEFLLVSLPIWQRNWCCWANKKKRVGLKPWFCFSRQMKSPAITTTLEGKNKTLYLQVM